MKFKYLSTLILFLIFANILCKSANYKTILLKNRNNEYTAIPIENHRIIAFTNNNICFTNNNNLDKEVSSLFSIDEYRHISFTKDEMCSLIDSEDKEFKDQNRLSFDRNSNKVILYASNPRQYIIYLFSVNGELLLTTNFDEKGEVYLPFLKIGIYVVTVIGEKSTTPLKFIIK